MEACALVNDVQPQGPLLGDPGITPAATRTKKHTAQHLQHALECLCRAGEALSGGAACMLLQVSRAYVDAGVGAVRLPAVLLEGLEHGPPVVPPLLLMRHPPHVPASMDLFRL